MPSAAHLIALRRRRRAQESRRPTARLGLGCSAFASLGLILVILLAAILYADLTRDLPAVETLAALLEPPDGLLLQPTRLYDRNGVHILTLQNRLAGERQYLRFIPPDLRSPGDAAYLPQALMDATLAAADPDFWSHPGFPLPGLHKTDRSTIAQRLVSDLLLAEEPPSSRRSLRQSLLAAQVTAHYGRIKVLEYFLNSVYYGHLAYGADAASRLYFGKPAVDLSLAEAAALAAVAESPNLNPFDAPQEALARQKSVLQALLRYRMISPEAGIQAVRETLSFNPAAADAWAYDPAGLGEYPAYLELLFQQIETAIPRRRLERGGLSIYTSLDSDMQIQAVCALHTQQTRLAGQALAGDAADCPAARLLPALPDEAILSTSFTADLLILDPLAGQVLALVGIPPIDLAGSILPSHPAGSLSTSFIYLTAFTRGLSPASLVWDIPPAATSIAQDVAAAYHGPMRLRIAQANDYPNPAASILALVGVENTWRTARQFGLLAPGAPLPSNAVTPDTLLGDVNLLAAGQAFGALANQGVMVGRSYGQGYLLVSPAPSASRQPATLQPLALLRVTEAGSGRVLLDWSAAQTRPIVTAQLAYLLTDVLSDEPARWPSLGHPNALEIGRPAAARLASNASGDSHWALGYTPQRVAGVWLSLDQGALPTANDSALLSQAAAGLWRAMMQFAVRDLPSQAWSVPAGISRIKVCDPSGMLPTRACSNLVEEVFAAGSEPVQIDMLYQAAPVNRQTGRLATVFTPPDLIESRVFFIAPPEAQIWAGQSGLEMPPQVYDTIPLETPRWPGAAILSPEMFAVLRGKVQIRGSAGGENFAFFRVQTGQGMNPQRWQQIGSDNQSKMEDGLLAIWDTTGLNGLYAIQLLVVQSDKTVQRVTTLVSIDNTPPQLQINYPTNAALIGRDRRRIIFQVSASDELGLQSVVFYLDGSRLASFTQPPYAAGWPVAPGAHTLRVVATDQAGNSAESSIEFTVE